MTGKSSFLLAALLLAAFFIMPVTAENAMEKTENNEIIVIPSFDKYNPAISGTKAQNQISEGEIISHSRYVWPFTSKIDVTLSWNENYGDLELYVYRSDDTLIGHYTDLYDSSSKDGLIDIDIKTSSGFLPMGDWKLNVYGREVSGASLDYSLT